MVRKILFFFAFAASLQAYSQEGSFVLRVAAFFPEATVMQRIYDRAFPDYQLEWGRMISRDVALWTNVAYTRKSGRSIGLGDRTSFVQVPWTVGAKYYFLQATCEKPYRLYLGAGGGVAYVRFRDHSEFVRPRVERWGMAFLAKSGVEFLFERGAVVDLFFDWSQNLFSFKRTPPPVTYNTQTGGIKVGIGWGTLF